MKRKDPGPVMIDLAGTELTELEIERLQHPAVGGVILFSRSYHNPQQVTALIEAVRSHCPNELLIAVDQEGGRVQRFRTGMTRLPPAACYSEADNPVEIADTAGWLMASELLSLGVDISFAPVLDVDCGISQIIADRSFSQQPERVTELALAFRAGLNRAGMAATGKHFPGHGGVALDSHLALPHDDRSLEALMARDLKPFHALIEAGLEGIMPAHVIYSQLDDQPAGFSRYWIGEVLRRRLAFDGVVFSDDLSMEGAAIAGNYPQRAEAAMEAGCDMVLVCNQPEASDEVLAHFGERYRQSPQGQRIIKLQARRSVDRAELLACSEWRIAVNKIEPLTAAME